MTLQSESADRHRVDGDVSLLDVEWTAPRHRVSVKVSVRPLPAAEGAAPLGLGTTRVLGIVDVVAVLAAVAVAPYPVSVSHLVFGITLLGLNFGTGLNRSRLTLAIVDDLGSLAVNALVAFALATTLGVLTGPSHRVTHIAPLVAYYVFAVALRALVFAGIRFARRRRWVAHRTLIVGAGEVGARLATLLQEHPECGLRPIGFIDAGSRRLATGQPLPVVGQAQHLADVITREHIKHVILGFPSGRATDLIDAIRTCDRLACEIWAVPRMFELSQAKSSEIDTLWGIPLMRLRRGANRSLAWRVKRVIDIVAAVVALVLLVPVLSVLALMVRVALGRPILFRQQRLGIDGRPFTLLKFRTLPLRSSEETAISWTSGTLPVSRVGRWLRRTSLDELPQLWNIVRGDMSLVGPRPERPYFVEQFSERYPEYVARHRVPSGLTGWAQIHGLRGDTSIKDRARFDNYYIDNWSLSLDLRILLRTIFVASHREKG